MFRLNATFLGSLIMLVVQGIALQAQDFSAADPKEDSGKSEAWNAMLWPLNKGGDSYVKFGVGSQIWVRYINNNPGTVNAAGEVADQSFDIALRRMRLSVLASLDKYMLYTQFGVNNQTYVNGGIVTPLSENKKPGLFFHDFWLKRTIVSEKLYLGIGLNAWNGISRLSNVGYGKNFTLDNPTFNFPNIERSDQIGRKIGLFVHGNIKRVNYRFSVSKPFAFDRPASSLPYVATEISSEKLESKGYLFYQFFDQESFKTPFTTMSYLGAKKLFNVGFGFDYLPASTMSTDSRGSTVIHNKLQLGFDFLLELPYSRGSVFSLYGVGYFYDFGPNYLRSVGVMNIGNGGSFKGNPLVQGGGNASFGIGTGNIYCISSAYILPSYNSWLGRLQPFAAVNVRNFEALDEPAFCQNIGLNYLIKGNQIKYSFEYSTRPIYSGIPGTEDRNVIVDRKGLFIFQVQLVL